VTSLHGTLFKGPGQVVSLGQRWGWRNSFCRRTEQNRLFRRQAVWPYTATSQSLINMTRVMKIYLCATNCRGF
jgi:hypothetical protein